jgi:hypothetical protein
MRKVRLASVLWLLSCAVYAQGQAVLGKPVSMSCVDCQPSEALQQLSQVSGVNIVFTEKIFEGCPKQTILASQRPLEEVLLRITSCASIDYKVFGQTLAITRRVERASFSGYVRDARTGELVIGAQIFLGNEANRYGALTNEYGFFSITVDQGRYLCQIAGMGYHLHNIQADIFANQLSVFSLQPDVLLPEVVVTALQGSTGWEGGEPESTTGALPLNRLRTVTSPGGEPDLLRMVALEPGIQTGVDGLGGMHIRGGNADQNLFLLDDVPVYNPSHALGMLSIFNPDNISQVRLWKGDAPVRYGGRNSGVLDVRTRDGNLREHHAQVSAGLFASTLTLEGPVIRDKSSLLLSGRMSYFQPWLRYLSREDDFTAFTGDKVLYRFYDINAKWNHQFTPRNKINLSFYHGGDVYSDVFRQESETQQGVVGEVFDLSTAWGNTIAAIRWNHLSGQKLCVNTVARYSNFHYRSRQAYQSTFFPDGGGALKLYNYGELYQTDIEDWSVKSDVTYYPSNGLIFRWGASYTYHEFRPGALTINYLQPGQSPSTADSIASAQLNNDRRLANNLDAYLDAEWQLSGSWRIEAGVRAIRFQQQTAIYPGIQTALRLIHHPSSTWRYWAGYHRNVQNLHQIGTYNIGLPFELWVPSTAKVGPEVVHQLTTGATFSKGRSIMTLELYNKHFEGILALLYAGAGGGLFSGGSEDARSWEDRAAVGTGRSYGAELSYRYQAPKGNAFVSYALSKATRQFDDINSGRPFPFQYDRRHVLTVGGNRKLNRWLAADVTWVFSSGYPITLTGLKYQHQTPTSLPGRQVLLYTEVNGYRLPAYHRLDASLLFNWSFKRVYQQLQVGVYNAYNRFNPFYLMVDPNSRIPGRALQYTLLPTLPVLNYKVKI